MAPALAVAGAAVTVIAGTAAPSAAGRRRRRRRQRGPTTAEAFSPGASTTRRVGDEDETDRDAPFTGTGLAPAASGRSWPPRAGSSAPRCSRDGTVCTGQQRERPARVMLAFTDRNAPAPVPGNGRHHPARHRQKPHAALSSRGESLRPGEPTTNGQLGEGPSGSPRRPREGAGLAGVRQVAAGASRLGPALRWHRSGPGQEQYGPARRRDLSPTCGRAAGHGLTADRPDRSGWSTSYASARTDGRAWRLNGTARGQTAARQNSVPRCR